MSQTKKASQIYNGALFPIAGDYIIDPQHSFAGFIAQHLMVGQVRGSFHPLTGNIRIADDPALSSLEISIDTASINTHNATRDEDLRSERFLDVRKFPAMTYSSTAVTAEPRGHLTVEGELTIRDVTRPVSFDVVLNGIADDPWGNTRAAFEGSAKISRRDFGLMTDLMRETGGLLVGKDIVINIAAELLLKK
ncbi:MAG: YceI family protein [Candidatus Methanoperedens sp.]|nr:YceI family protein [Candidatus Methanoperedens sp.]